MCVEFDANFVHIVLHVLGEGGLLICQPCCSCLNLVEDAGARVETGSQLINVTLDVLAYHFDMGYFVTDLEGVCVIGSLQGDQVCLLAEAWAAVVSFNVSE